MRAKSQNLWRNFIALNNHDKSAVTLWKMKNSIPCSFFEWRNCVNWLNFAQSGFRGKNGGQSGPFAGDPFLQALQKYGKQNSVQASFIIWKLRIKLNPQKLACKQALSGGTRPPEKGVGGGRGEGSAGHPVSETRGTQSQKKKLGPFGLSFV